MPTPRVWSRRGYSAEMRAAEEIARKVSRISALAGALLLVPAMFEANQQMGSAPFWWRSVSVVILIATLGVLGSSRAPRRVIRVLWAAYPTMWVAASIAWSCWIALSGRGPGPVPWIWTLAPFVIAIAALRWRLAPGLVCVVVPPATGLVAAAGLGGALSPSFASVAALHLANAFFVVMILAARDHLLATWLAARALATKEHQLGLANAWRVERDRLAALMHDQVLGTLRAASMDGIVGPQLARAARNASALLSAPHEPARSGPASAGEPFADSIRALALATGVPVLVSGDIDAVPIPAPVAEAVLAASAQAIQNSILHARPVALTVRRVVHAHLVPGLIRVEIADDGTGFDPATVPASRLGIRLSILARMESVPGGTATLQSEPGRGTKVVLDWCDPRGSGLAAEQEPDAELEELPIPEIGNVVGVTSRAGLATVLLGWFGGLVWLLLAWPHLSQPPVVVGAVGWLLVAILLACWSAGLSRWSTLLIALTPAVTSAALLVQWDHLHTDEVWLLQLGADVGAILALRGRTRPAVAGSLLQVAVVLALAFRINALGAGFGLILMPSITMLAAIILNRGLQRSIEVNLAFREAGARARTDQQAAQQAAARAASWLQQVARLATPCLDELARGMPPDSDLKERCNIVAAAIRDLLRAPSLTSGPIPEACAQARRHGVQVELLDDGRGLTMLSLPTQERLAVTIKAMASGRITVRVLPPGRSKAATAVIETEGVVTRVEFTC